MALTRSAKLAASGMLIALVTILSLVFASTGVRGPDGPYGTQQPDDDSLTLDLQVQAAFDDDNIYFRYSWPTESPNLFYDVYVYRDGVWEEEGGASDGSVPELYEDRLTFMLDDGSVDGFAQYGGFLTAYSHTRSMQPEDTEGEEVEAVYGEGNDELGKQLPETLEDTSDWRTRQSQDRLDSMQEAGYYLDLWHWRSARSNALGWSDDQYVLDSRADDEGRSPFSTNWDDELEQPSVMFDPAATGGDYALDWEKIREGGYTTEDVYYLSDETMVEYDPDHEWAEGDALPRRILRAPEESRGDIAARGVVEDGRWDVVLTRALDTGNPDDKALTANGRYFVAPAVHTGGTTQRFHYIGMPFSLGLDRAADIEAERVSGEPDWAQVETHDLTLFYPGVISWDYLTDSSRHPGADAIASNASFDSAHTAEKMSFYAVESEFRSQIKRQWALTGAVWAFFILAASIAVVRLSRRDTLEPAYADSPDDRPIPGFEDTGSGRAGDPSNPRHAEPTGRRTSEKE